MVPFGRKWKNFKRFLVMVVEMKRFFVLLPLVALMVSGCFLTKVVTVPMRVTGALISVVPVVGEEMDDAVDSAADTVDKIPL